MIIKSMTRKTPNPAKVRELIHYIVRESDDYILHNFFAHKPDELVKEFASNASLLAKRKNGNYYYHEVISLTRSTQIDEAKQKQIFRDLIQQYIATRANGCLVLAGLHDEKDNNLHYHVMISANEVGHRKRHSLKKYQFDQVKRGLERYTNERYPELEQGQIIDQQYDPEKARSSNKEGELKRRTKKPSQKEQLAQFLKDLMGYSQSKSQFSALLAERGLRLEQRGKNLRVIDAQGKAHRLTTLGLMDSYEKLGEHKEPTPEISDEPKVQETPEHSPTPESEASPAPHEPSQSDREKPSDDIKSREQQAKDDLDALRDDMDRDEDLDR